LTSVLAFVSVDWWFVGPVGDLIWHNAQEWFGLALMLLVSISTGSLAAGLQQSAAEARRRAFETATLYELSIAIMADTSLEHVLRTFVGRLTAALGLRAAVITLATEHGIGPAARAAADAGTAATAGTDPEPRRLLARLDGMAGGLARSRSARPVQGNGR